MLSMSKVGIDFKPSSIRVLTLPPTISPVFTSTSMVNSSPASIQILPVFSSIMSSEQNRPAIKSIGTLILICFPPSINFLTCRGVIFFPCSAITSPVSVSIKSKAGFVPLDRSGKNFVDHESFKYLKSTVS